MKPEDVIAGRFKIGGLAGAGGMGCVYRALDRETGALVAVKVLTHDAERNGERFAREARLLEQLRHPSIVRYVTHGATPAGELFLVMEWLDGEDLSTRLARGPLGVPSALALARRVLGGLAAAHTLGVIHRDLKPNNIFLEGGDAERAKLLDFGIARLQGADLTRTGNVLGTPGYMAPEQVRGDRNLDPRADVFSLGCVLFECLAGRPAFAGEHAMAILAKILLEAPPRLASFRGDVPEALEDLIARAMSKSADDRPADAGALDRALAALDDGLDPRDAPAQATPRLTEREQRRLYVVVTAPEIPAPGVTIATDVTVSMSNVHDLRRRLKVDAGAFGAEVELLADGSVIATLAGGGSATDHAAAAARCALALRAVMPTTPMAIATGSGELTGGLPVGEVIDRAVALLRGAMSAAGEPASIRTDAATADLLGARFEIGGDASRLVLRCEREPAEAARTLLGRPSPCVGRDRELAVLESFVRECADEELARAVVVTAPPGVGKSRLLRELLARIERGGQPLEVWIARGDPMSAGSPFGMLAQVVRRAAGIRDGEPAATRSQKLRGRVRSSVPEAHAARVADFLGELAGAPSQDAESPELHEAREDAVTLGEQIRRAFSDFLAAECAARLVILVLEDLHWGDVPTVKAIDAALRDLRERRLLVIALGRPEVHELFPRLWAGRAATEMALAELPRKAGERLVRTMLGEATPADVVDKLVSLAAGNAFYLEELIRAVAEGRGAALPDTVLAMVDARLEALGAEERRVLRAAGVFGEVFWRSGLAALLGAGVASAHLEAMLAALVDGEVIERRAHARFPDQDEYAFRHGLIREAAYRRLTDADRALGHRLAGDWLERAGEADASVLAEHFDLGGAPERAVPWYVRAGQDAIAGSSFERGIAVAKRGAACGASGLELGLLRLIQTEAHAMRFELAECTRAGAEALAVLETGTGPWFGAAGMASMASALLGDRDRAAAHLQALIAAEPKPGAITSGMMGYCWAMMVLSYSGLYAAGAGVIERAEALQARFAPDDRAAAAFLVQSRAWGACTEDNPGKRLALARLAAATRDEIVYSGFAVRAYADLGAALQGVGAYDEAERAFAHAMDAAERTGTVHGTTFLALHLGTTRLERGRPDQAEPLLLRVDEACRRAGEVYYAGRARVQLARLFSQRGDLDGAEREVRKATDYPQSRPLRAYASAALSTILLAQGRTADALAAAAQGKRLFDALGAVHEGDALIHLALAEALEASGDASAAASALAAARDRLIARAATIEEPALQASFLENVRDHARTLALASATLGAARGDRARSAPSG